MNRKKSPEVKWKSTGNNIRTYLLNFWEKSKDFSQFSFREKFFFYCLCVFEVFYKIGFSVVLCFKKKISGNRDFSFKIISVGNLSVGGTGKSVFVPYLIKHVKAYNGAIVLRGYKGQNENSSQSILVCDEKNGKSRAFFFGDEACMFASRLNVPVVVGSDRAKSCCLLEKLACKNDKKIEMVVLDDAYQNFQVKKDCQILLLDARAPFENGHCLPAGRLREKDYSRADFIILTRADGLNEDYANSIKTGMLSNFDKQSIFFARHKIDCLLRLNSHPIKLDNIKGRVFFVVAAIASFKYLVEDLKCLGIVVFDTKEYPDHYRYKAEDIPLWLDVVKNNHIDGIITTQKDWVKIFPIIEKMAEWQDLPIYVLSVSFEFLSQKEHDVFLYKLREKLK